ncbi:hypothetical protein E2C01_068171 [Portunus trituberculatus]|uniref:Uncharacterized protein n=1 Tax=Portunus trituberculatus TaxID=210409 RepID=A0A5B7HR80_PORTR|nr:hypothetical protein [Portunus trituberculatus]
MLPDPCHPPTTSHGQGAPPPAANLSQETPDIYLQTRTLSWGHSSAHGISARKTIVTPVTIQSLDIPSWQRKGSKRGRAQGTPRCLRWPDVLTPASASPTLHHLSPSTTCLPVQPVSQSNLSLSPTRLPPSPVCHHHLSPSPTYLPASPVFPYHLSLPACPVSHTMSPSHT